MRQNWSQLISVFRESGQTHKAFCDTHNLSVSTFQSYLYKKHPVAVNKEDSFVRLMPLAERQNNLPMIGLHFSNGGCLKLPSDYPVNSLRILVKMAMYA